MVVSEIMVSIISSSELRSGTVKKRVRLSLLFITCSKRSNDSMFFMTV